MTRLVKLGATDYITKPFHVEVIKVTVAKVLEMSKVSKSARKSESSERIASGGEIKEPYARALFTQLLRKELERSATVLNVKSSYE